MNMFFKGADKALWLECVLAVPTSETEILDGLADYLSELLVINRTYWTPLGFNHSELALQISEWLSPESPFEVFSILRIQRVGFLSRLFRLTPVITFTKRYSNEPLERIPRFLWQALKAKNIEFGYGGLGDE